MEYSENFIQNLSNGIEFGSKEEFMMPFNDWIKNSMWRIERFFKSIVSASVTPSPTVGS